jgi:hypothetical protein
VLPEPRCAVARSGSLSMRKVRTSARSTAPNSHSAGQCEAGASRRKPHLGHHSESGGRTRTEARRATERGLARRSIALLAGYLEGMLAGSIPYLVARANTWATRQKSNSASPSPNSRLAALPVRIAAPHKSPPSASTTRYASRKRVTPSLNCARANSQSVKRC